METTVAEPLSWKLKLPKHSLKRMAHHSPFSGLVVEDIRLDVLVQFDRYVKVAEIQVWKRDDLTARRRQVRPLPRNDQVRSRLRIGFVLLFLFIRLAVGNLGWRSAGKCGLKESGLFAQLEAKIIRCCRLWKLRQNAY